MIFPYSKFPNDMQWSSLQPNVSSQPKSTVQQTCLETPMKGWFCHAESWFRLFLGFWYLVLLRASVVETVVSTWLPPILGSFRTSTKVLEIPTSRPAESKKLHLSSNLLHHKTFTLYLLGRLLTTFSISLRYSAVNTRCLPCSQPSLSEIPKYTEEFMDKLLSCNLKLQRLFGQSNLLAF